MNDRISKVLNHPATIPVAVGVGSFVSGVVTGYILGKRRRKEVFVEQNFPAVDLNLHREDVALLQEAETVSDSTQLEESEERPEPVTVAPDFFEPFAKTKLKDIISLQSSDDEELPPQPEFAPPDGTWNYEEEIKNRTSDQPYIIHRDEFFEDDDEFDYRQVTLTYYAGDDIVADAQDDSPMYNYAQTLGELKFGHGSGDPTIVYIRNPKLRMDYEVVRSEGMFSVEVEGLQIENNERARDLRHSSGPPRFRDD